MNCVQELLKKTADLERTNTDGSTPLMAAAHRAEAEACEYLLMRNSSVMHQDQDGWTPLMYSVNVMSSSNSGEQAPAAKKISSTACNKRNITEMLLLRRADVNWQTPEGLSALMVGAGRNRAAEVRLLVEHRGQVNLKTSKGQHALLMAAAQ